MNLSDTVREISKELNISLAEVARRVGQSPQNLSKKLNRGTLSFEEFETILKTLGVGMDVAFTLPGGETSMSGNEWTRSQMKILQMQLDVERMKSKYFSDISYNYRTALSTVSGSLEIAKRHAGDVDKVKECIAKMMPAVTELTRLIEDSPFNREAGIIVEEATLEESEAGRQPEGAEGSLAEEVTEPLSASDGLEVELARNNATKKSAKRVLLVDDNDLNREIARELLEDSGITVEEATGGSQSVAIIQEKPAGYYDLIFMDLVMPDMDGFEAARTIRALGSEKADVPIAAMTASVGDEERDKAKEAGMDGFIEKPLDLNRLLKLMREL